MQEVPCLHRLDPQRLEPTVTGSEATIQALGWPCRVSP